MIFDTKILNKMVTVKLIKKIRNRHTYLRIKNSELIEISSNPFFTINDAKKLIEKKKEWIEKRINFVKKDFLSSDEYLFLGEKYKLDESIKNIDEFYRKKAKEIIPLIVEKYSKEMKLHSTSLKFRKNKNTWGSCNYKNGLNFNILLVKYPIEIVEYVVIHELAHIKHKNHSKRFWNLVEVYCPDYKNRMKLFKTFL
ncbi:M48 family metallopeptidase [Arcobacter sp. LA11]|uniref:M48 family metallopeptidase n=1 Tax=Arcobacter sp. LA11 TaxID=1898176 RepID=UPI000934B109|nr:SprT family zinc-dependent metalloprotease [Arcobacter sp. LA11]